MQWPAAIVLVLLTLMAYFPAMQGDFVWDDNIYLLENPSVRNPGGLRDIWLSAESVEYYPLFYTSLWLEWRLWGEDARGYHASNVALHVVNVILLWLLLLRLGVPGAWWAAALFAIHPVNAESVAWISERKNTLAMLFFLLALLCWVRFEAGGRQPRYYILAFVMFVLALLSKTAVVMLPAVMLLMVWWRRGRLTWRDTVATVPFFAVGLLLGVVLIWFFAQRTPTVGLVRETDLVTRLAEAGINCWFYLVKAVVPAGLCFVYPHWPTDIPRILTFVPAILLLAAVVGYWRYRRVLGRGIGFGVGCFVLLLIPALGLVYHPYLFQSPVADRWQYFPLIGVTATVAALVVVWRDRSSGAIRKTLPLAGAAILCLLAVLTWQRASLFADAERLNRATLSCNPGAVVARNNLGLLLIQKGQYAEARQQLERAVHDLPEYGEAHSNLATLLVRLDEPQLAIQHLRTAVEHQPRLAMAHFNLGAVLANSGRAAEAISAYEAGLALVPHNTRARAALTEQLIAMGRLPAAERHLRELLQVTPRAAPLRCLLADVQAAQGRGEEAATLYQQALRLDPRLADAHFGLAKVSEARGRGRDAASSLRQALRYAPDHPGALRNLAWILATDPDLEFRNGSEAVTLAQKAVRLGGGDPAGALEVLAAAYAASGRFADAVATIERAEVLAGAAGDADTARRSQAQREVYADGRALPNGTR